MRNLKNFRKLVFFGFFFSIFSTFVSDCRASQVYYVHSDHLGSTAVITNESGEVVQSDYYYPFGSSRSPSLSLSDDSLLTTHDSPPSITDHKYTSQISDEDQTGLYYYNARYYDPQIAKFTQADTMKDGFNGYSYVANNPINATDPTGNMMWPGDGGGGGGGGKESDPPISDSKENNDGLLSDFDDYGSLEGIRPLNNVQYLGEGWTIRKKNIVNTALLNVLNKIADTLGINIYQAYALVYTMNGGMKFTLKDGYVNVGFFAEEKAFDQINLYNNKIDWSWTDDRLIKLTIHELGHAFDDTVDYYFRREEISLPDNFSDLPENSLSIMLQSLPVYKEEYWGGSKGDMNDYFRSSDNMSEIFADMFVGWIFGTLDPTAQVFMDTRMKEWLTLIADSQSQPQTTY